MKFVYNQKHKNKQISLRRYTLFQALKRVSNTEREREREREGGCRGRPAPEKRVRVRGWYTM